VLLERPYDEEGIMLIAVLILAVLVGVSWSQPLTGEFLGDAIRK
jgi:hypothetical protein